MLLATKGIDVSKWNGTIDWDKVKPQIDFAMIRAGAGLSIDKQALRNVKECERLHIPYGLYWFSYAYTSFMAVAEANAFISFIGEHRPEYPIVFDFEYDSVNYAKKFGVIFTKQLLEVITFSFCRTLEGKGYYVSVYSNYDYMRNWFTPSVFKSFDLWYAYPFAKCNRKVNLWQYSFKGKIDGMKGNVDLNYSYKDYPTIIKNNHLNGW